MYPEHGTAHFNNVAYIPINGNSITPQNKQNEKEENSQKIMRSFSTKMWQLIVYLRAKQLYQTQAKLFLPKVIETIEKIASNRIDKTTIKTVDARENIVKREKSN